MQAVISADLFARAALAMGADPTRYHLCGVYVEPCVAGGVTLTATNGTYLLSFHDAHAHFTGEPTIIAPTAAALKAMRAKDVSGSRVVVVNDTRLEVVEDAPATALERMPALIGEGRRSLIQAEACVVDGAFPEWRRVVPRDDLAEGTRAAIDMKLLTPLGAALSRGDKLQFLRFYARTTDTGDQIPHLVRGNDPRGFGVVMSGSMRPDVTEPLVPGWA